MHSTSRSRMPKFLWYFALCACVWFVARVTKSNGHPPTATVPVAPVLYADAAVASDEPACGSVCGQVARRSTCCESQKVVTCCDAEHPLACEADNCDDDTGSTTPEAVLALMERLAPEAFAMPTCTMTSANGETMVGNIGMSSDHACDREAMLACLRQLDTDHHVRAAAAACEVACDEEGDCYVARVCTDPLVSGAPTCASPCAQSAVACSTSNFAGQSCETSGGASLRCQSSACKPSSCATTNCATPACGTTVCSAPAYPALPVASYAYCTPAVAPPAYYAPAASVCPPSSYPPTSGKWHSLNSSSMQLESVAQGLESAELYEESDRVRQLAQELRMAARVARRAASTVSVQVTAPPCEPVAPPAEVSLPAPPCDDSACTVQPVSGTAQGHPGCLSIRVGFCDRPCQGTGASPGSEACTGSSGESCCNACPEACPEACSAACTSPCKARCKSECEAARTASRPTEFGILVDTDAEGHPIFRRVE